MNHTELYLMMTVTGREHIQDFMKLYRDKGLEVHTLSLGHGTADLRYLRLLALDTTEKMVCFTVLTGRKWLEVKKGMTVRLRIDAAGIGIACIVPLSAVGGKRELMYLTEGQGYEKGAEAELKGTEQELIVVISNQGYTEEIMDPGGRRPGRHGDPCPGHRSEQGGALSGHLPGQREGRDHDRNPHRNQGRHDAAHHEGSGPGYLGGRGMLLPAGYGYRRHHAAAPERRNRRGGASAGGEGAGGPDGELRLSRAEKTGIMSRKISEGMSVQGGGEI